MSAGGQEIEAKFYIRHLSRVRSRLEQRGAHLIQDRVLETNLRFDLPGETLRATGRVLRLRQDTDARITYKSASREENGILRREETELVVEDFEKARQLLEALGYRSFFSYEKYRTTYQWNETLTMLDELPYGNFVEIEGETGESICNTASQLHLNWENAIAASYHALFERARRALSLSIKSLSFAEFEGIHVEPSALGVYAADE